jgi:hypothetical protein
MKLLIWILFAVGVALPAGAVWIGLRRRHNLVSPGWLNENLYARGKNGEGW